MSRPRSGCGGGLLRGERNRLAQLELQLGFRRQMDLFLAGLDPLLLDIIKLDISRMTPKTALAKLQELKGRAESQASMGRKE